MFEQASDQDIQARCAKDPDFRRLHDHHRKLDRRIDGAEVGVGGLSDAHMSELKRDRLHTKEAMIRRWNTAIQSR